MHMTQKHNTDTTWTNISASQIWGHLYSSHLFIILLIQYTMYFPQGRVVLLTLFDSVNIHFDETMISPALLMSCTYILNIYVGRVSMARYTPLQYNFDLTFIATETIVQ